MVSLTESPTQSNFPDRAFPVSSQGVAVRNFGPPQQVRVDSNRSEGSRRSVQFQEPPHHGTPQDNTPSDSIEDAREDAAESENEEAEPSPPLNQRGRMSTFDSTDPRWVEQFVLSLDGGGVRGYSTLLILKKLMQLIQEEETNPTVEGNAPVDSSYHPHTPNHLSEDGVANGNSRPQARFLICHYFDYIVGTSTGGLIAIMLSRLRMSVDDAIDQYANLAGEIFGKPRIFSMRGPFLFPRPKYKASKMADVMKRVVQGQHASRGIQRDQQGSQRVSVGVFSQEPTLNSEPLMCRTVCVSYTNAEANRDHAFLFRSYEHIPTGNPLERNAGPAHAIPIWKVGRATTAAFSYFRPMEIDGYDFIDGGFGCNNPSWEAYNEIDIMGNGPPIGMFLSIGTGSLKERRFPALSTATAIAAIFQGIRAAVKLATNVENAHESMLTVSKPGGQKKFDYLRYSVLTDIGNIRLDEWKQKSWRNNESTKETIERLTETYFAEESPNDSSLTVEQELRGIAKVLIKSRRARSETARWEIVAMGTRYRCVVPGCRAPQKVRQTANDLHHHIQLKHPDILAERIDYWVDEGRIDGQP